MMQELMKLGLAWEREEGGILLVLMLILLMEGKVEERRGKRDKMNNGVSR